MIGSHQTVILLDFGSQYTQLIARRVRESGVYCEIHPYHRSASRLWAAEPSGLILSGGPESVFAEEAPHPDPEIYRAPCPVLGICYGMQLLSVQFGGRVEPGSRTREYGRAEVTEILPSRLLSGVEAPTPVWMSHGDEIQDTPDNFQVVARTASSIAAMENPELGFWAVQFHPEVAHTLCGKTLLRNFLLDICGCRGDWTPASFVEEAQARVADQIGQGRAICGLSGGVDSTVAAVLVHRAIGSRLTCIFVDNGLLRQGEFSSVLKQMKQLELNLVGVRAAEEFLQPLRGVLDPEQKRKIIGRRFIRVFEREARRLGDYRFLVQGTLYPDVIESVSVKGPSVVIKSHHNVGGLPERMNLRLVEPLRELFKDEVREVGRRLGLPGKLVERHPFPGPGLAVRIVGEVTDRRLRLLRQADSILLEEICAAGLYDQMWQSFAVLLPIQSVGVMGDGRTYEYVLALRAVTSQDGMTADWATLPYDLLARTSNRIVNQVHGINRVVYDISSKPPSTIEWE